MSGRRGFAAATASGAAQSRNNTTASVSGDSLLRISQACETLLAGFNEGQAATLKSCLVSRDRAVAVSHAERERRQGGEQQSALPTQDFLPRVEEAIAHRRARPSLLLPAWRAVGFAVGTGSAALLPPDALSKVGASISKAVVEQYDANIRSMYEARIEQDETKVKDLFKAQRDDPARADVKTGGDELSSGESSTKGTANTRAMAIEGSLKSALRVACEITSKV